jgi:hypothetical protein
MRAPKTPIPRKRRALAARTAGSTRSSLRTPTPLCLRTRRRPGHARHPSRLPGIGADLAVARVREFDANLVQAAEPGLLVQHGETNGKATAFAVRLVPRSESTQSWPETMGARIRNTAAVSVALAAGCCVGGIGSTIDYSAFRTERQARFLANGDTLVAESENPQGMNLVVEPEPRLDDGRVALLAGYQLGRGRTKEVRSRLGRDCLLPKVGRIMCSGATQPTSWFMSAPSTKASELARRAVLDCRALHGTHPGLPSSRPSEP